MMFINVLEIITLHDKIITATGGSPGLRDLGLLESAVYGCYQSFDIIELYPTVIEKAARMAYFVLPLAAFSGRAMMRQAAGMDVTTPRHI